MKVKSSQTAEQSYTYHEQCTWLHCRSKWHWHCTSIDGRHAVEQSMEQSVTNVKKWMLWDIVVITLWSVVIIRFGCFPNVVGSSWPRRCCIIRHVYTSPVIHYHSTKNSTLQICQLVSSLVHSLLTQLLQLIRSNITRVQWLT